MSSSDQELSEEANDNPWYVVHCARRRYPACSAQDDWDAVEQRKLEFELKDRETPGSSGKTKDVLDIAEPAVGVSPCEEPRDDG